MAKGTTTINFGSKETTTSVNVSEPTITGGQMVEAWVVPTATSNNTADNHWVEDLKVTAGPANPGVGFTIYAKCGTGFAHGQYTIGYVFA